MLRLGDPAFTSLLATSTLPEFPAYPTYWDEHTSYIDEYQPDPAGYLIRSTANSRTTAYGQQPCVLGVGSDAWLYDTDGLPSNSENNFLAVAPCFTIPVGSDMGTALESPKVITILRDDGHTIQTAPFLSYTETYSEGGIRQAVTVDGTGYWLAGLGANDWGVRYLVNGTNYTTSVTGNTAGTPGYNDARGLTVFNDQLYGSDSELDDGWAGMFSIGVGLPTTASSTTLLPGTHGDRRGVWTFCFENSTSIWAAITEDDGVAPPGNIGRFVLLSGAWTQHGNDVVLDHDLPVYSITGRYEYNIATGNQRHFIAYANTDQTLYRYDASTRSSSVLATAPPGQHYRGVALPPSCSTSPTPTSSVTASTTASPSNTPCPTFAALPPLGAGGDIVVVRLGDYAIHDYNVVLGSLGWAYPGMCSCDPRTVLLVHSRPLASLTRRCSVLVRSHRSLA